MNIAEYINSGILMDYCLGLLAEDDMKKVEQLFKEHPQIATELRLLQNGLENYAAKNTNWKNENLKEKIWNTIDEMNKNKNNS
jgi:anti-sigma-K factor RskA